MATRRSFFKSLALLGAAAVGCPGIFIPKFEPVRWKVQTPHNARDFFGKWNFVMGDITVREMTEEEKVIYERLSRHDRFIADFWWATLPDPGLKELEHIEYGFGS